ncbi:hypothetical protein [Nostoc sp. TCL26-01]|uniref:hypothetical protein n=1 Tax=Nostoc sp. TCL26-01 TaxID=2576904 RepID=UPI0015C15B6A|nr:hypothetical protein [Nostoc sp. TCL26-01]QLE56993.1 hypothetical protein FD725_16595 [Nostoc sp. TCL26-01]
MPIELSQFRKNLLYAVQAPLVNVMHDLQTLSEIDSLAERQQKKYGKQALFSFIGGIVLFIFAIVVSDKGGIAIALFFTTLALLIFSIYALVRRSKFKHLNIGNYRYNLTKQVVQMLARDMDTASIFDINLSFQAIEKKEHLISTNSHPHKSGWKIDSFLHEWLIIKSQFLDKTRFELRLTGMAKKQYGWKRGSSGKSKYKSKSKSGGLDIDLSLTYPQRRYGAVKIFKNEINDAIKLPQTSILRGLRVTEKAIQISVRLAPQFAEDEYAVYQTITSMFLSGYQVLNLAKLIAK